jgi:uncharacterized Rmd1/YagE family protein
MYRRFGSLIFIFLLMKSSRHQYSRLATDADIEGQPGTSNIVDGSATSPTTPSSPLNPLQQQQQQQTRARAPKHPNRTTKTSQKLVVFPENVQDFQQEFQVTDVASDYGETLTMEDVPPSLVQYPYHIAREKEAERMRRLNKDVLPRVTAYITAKSYDMKSLMKYLQSLCDSNGTKPQQFDECVYTPYTPPISIFQFSPNVSRRTSSRRHQQGGTAAVNAAKHRTTPVTIGARSRSSSPSSPTSLKRNSAMDKERFQTPPPLATLIPIDDEQTDRVPAMASAASTEALTLEKDDMPLQTAIPSTSADGPLQSSLSLYSELFFFDYGVVVCWGLTEPQEKYVLSLLVPFEQEKLDADEIETEEFRYQYRPHSQARIFNDIITLRAPTSSSLDSIRDGDPRSLNQPPDHMIKLTISHAMAQSVTLALFEGRIEDSIDTTKHIPLVMAKTGKVPMGRTAIIKKIGQLFIMRINVNLVSPILDTPEIFWSEVALDPLYNAIRGYLEISQRVELLNQRCSVISDLLDMLKEHLNSAHSETLEWIIIILIGIEIIIGLVTIAIDLVNMSGGKSQ